MIYFLSLLICTLSLAQELPPIPHLDLAMTGGEYQTALKARDDGEGKSELEPIIKMGKKFLDWLKLINENRPPEQKIFLSTPANQPGYPIESPRVSSPKIILDLFTKLKAELPNSIKGTILGSTSISQIAPVSDEDFVAWGLKIDTLYARASRWILQEPMLWGYAARKRTDIRGYYYLSQVTDLENKLIQWKNLSSEIQGQYSNWLKGLCFNSGNSETQCTSELETVIKKEGNPNSYYQSYVKNGKERWDELFLITHTREDIHWTDPELTLLKTPFKRPDSEEVLEFLRVNIEDEWRWGKWALNLDFIDGGWDTTHIEFVPGATPHVNALAGSTITMDANQPLTEYHVRWTLRHEFGHTLGFPDCYVEFYDTNTHEMISYQIDTSNLMCSRRGKLQQKHYEELKRVYFTP